MQRVILQAASASAAKTGGNNNQQQNANLSTCKIWMNVFQALDLGFFVFSSSGKIWRDSCKYRNLGQVGTGFERGLRGMCVCLGVCKYVCFRVLTWGGGAGGGGGRNLMHPAQIMTLCSGAKFLPDVKFPVSNAT